MTKISRTSGKPFFPALSSNRNCPVCKAPHVDRVKRRVVDRLISPLISIRRYHCQVCNWEGNMKVDRE